VIIVAQLGREFADPFVGVINLPARSIRRLIVVSLSCFHKKAPEQPGLFYRVEVQRGGSLINVEPSCARANIRMDRPVP
jgi:hypothetical protein